MKKSKNITGFDFLWLALYTTAAFLFELLLVTVEGFWGISLYHATRFQMIAHWIVTSLGWFGSGFGIIALAKKQTGFDLLKTEKKTVSVWQWLAMVGDCLEFYPYYTCPILGLEGFQNFD